MPIVTIDMFEGRSVEQKRELVRVLTDDISRICACDSNAVTIIIHDLPKTNISKAGILGSDRK
jgi:4-oxalocrotonate tautomerase